jgi:hypothetical protein
MKTCIRSLFLFSLVERPLMKFKRFLALALVVELFSRSIAAPTAYAAFSVLSNPNQFSINATLITFDEGDTNGHHIQPFDTVTTYRGVGFQVVAAPPGSGVSVAWDPTPPRQFGPGGDPGKTIVQYFPPPSQGVQITLPVAATQFGAEFEAVTAGSYTFTLFSGGQLVDSGTIPTGQIGQLYNFHAFQDDNSFDRVIVRGPANDDRVVLDNLRFNAVPEPSSVLMMGMSLAGLVALLWHQGFKVGVKKS